MAILVTGGAGYIGSHTVLALLERGEEVVVLDNLSNSSPESLFRVERLTGKKVIFYQGDIQQHHLLDHIFRQHDIHAVIHLAGLKSVRESTEEPLRYYQNNISGSLIVLDRMRHAGVKQFIFSSSATVYGPAEYTPLTENCRVGQTTNPYGTSKLIVEQILAEFASTAPQMAITALRYFNPAGAHESGLIGEDPAGIPNNLLAYLAQVAIGKLAVLPVYGNDYPTSDGTGVRDYIHVMDLAEGHLKALDNLLPGFNVYNLGTGKGYSVLEIIRAFERACGFKIAYQFSPRRAGDIAECWSDPSLAAEKLGWQAKRSLEKMVGDAWSWQSKNPQGYGSSVPLSSIRMASDEA
ncbi:UDP-glucose 4-epimerase GalE [Serratia proteamaculans]|uniref:UDP-glucose 4-epimerase GalE n=1 Tax=Serratia proteamaculans TaxID=28151 RepID=UPI0015A3E4CE|nr:UDP-glucose 4-epimerase GalE [Serratia proteamaculans]NWA70652.1 UDP-glucose 4-epimerase GalE [Serratia proteamaculans]CAI0857160.1 UDP-glucose 4-epimerase [Serratia proteamaculans]CAI0913925.1 UDP-glucose 4-epimerase [Serratia proteamaculans]CAI0918205.1 UDP-glucose 4-epimerase [Serratia proteamaculans]